MNIYQRKKCYLWAIFFLLAVIFTWCLLPNNQDRFKPTPSSSSVESAEVGADAVLETEDDRFVFKSSGDTPVKKYSKKNKLKETFGVVGGEVKTPVRKKATSSGLKAGFADDNKQYGLFLDFLNNYRDNVRSTIVERSFDVSERIVINVYDKEGKTVPNANVEVHAGGNRITAGRTYADGSFLFFPSLYALEYSEYDIKIKRFSETFSKSVKKDGVRQVNFTLENSRQVPGKIPLDIVFVLDTTGSMGEEINRLKQTIELINMNLTAVSPAPDIRFGMVLYKDTGDIYRTKIIPFTSDLNHFQTELNKVSAGGGGDTPEDLEAALDDALNKMHWNEDGIRLGFIITDAPPKIYSDQTFTYKEAAFTAKNKAIKLFSVGSGGLPIQGEYVLRQISQLTSAAYIFMTYGEKGEGTGGKAGSVSHHTGTNFQTDKLEAIIIRFAKTELRHLSDTPIELKDEYFQAVSIPDETKDETLKNIFNKAATQLVEYASFEILNQIPTAVLPIVADTEYKANAEFFTEQMVLALNGNSHFKSVARKAEMQSVEDELALGLSGMVNESNAAEVGNFIGASMLITGKLYVGEENYSIFIKLVRVDTAEILSVTKLVIDRKLGI